jgi:hypothetical protein
MDHKYTLHTEINADQTITQTLVSQQETLARWVCDTLDDSIRQALIEMGWTPPPNDKQIGDK